MTVSNEVRNMILKWLKEGKTFAIIMELVKAEGEKISKGGISYIKNNPITKKKQKKTEQETEQEKEEVQDHQTKIDIENAIEPLRKETEILPIQETELLSALEFNILESSFKTVYLSNVVRLSSANASGILNSLYTMRNIIETIKKRGNFNE